ncbi:hypothetical protein ACQEVM_37730 [Streptomyces sp. CA-243310]|uniref:hypothetical protein n=1 Tax=Streptomyces sp. CA-243310 TaxID=3240056 RepID=UPI003D92C7CE
MAPLTDVTATALALIVDPHDDGSATLVLFTEEVAGPAGRYTFHLDEHVARSLRLAADWVGKE